MPVKRQTAIKVRVLEITKGQWLKGEGAMDPSFVKTPTGEMVSRARVMGTIVGKFTADDGMFASATVDDSTDTIRAKTFKTVKPLDKVEVGDMVDLIGKVREWNDELYIIPETVTKVTDPNMELLRRAEILARMKSPKKASGEKKAAGKDDKEDLRKKVLEFIESGKEGVAFTDIIQNVKAPEEEMESVINELLSEGICYEPTPGKIKKI